MLNGWNGKVIIMIYLINNEINYENCSIMNTLLVKYDIL
jgi:hypothetical protein